MTVTMRESSVLSEVRSERIDSNGGSSTATDEKGLFKGDINQEPPRAVLIEDDVTNTEHRDPIDEDPNGDIKYKTLKWWQCGMLMIAETVSLGILSLPSTLATIGLIPGVIILIGLGFLATYSGYVIGQFKARFPWVHNFADAFEILFEPLGYKRFGRELGGAFQVIFLIFAMASHIVTWNICMRTLSNHATCNLVWGVIALFLFWFLDLPRTLRNVSYFSVACKCCMSSHVTTRVSNIICSFHQHPRCCSHNDDSRGCRCKNNRARSLLLVAPAPS